MSLLLLLKPRTASGVVVVVTGRFDPPSPSGASGEGGPSAGVFDPPSPGVTNA